ncbi:hypothetical protein [Streptomyces sp. DHE17-7]|uniref:hypothetical protein n=1 Tax=Streptomyces sp. DHE17-7 TaxID=2759949 RepID=UPI0022EA2D8A|nr:hypothetical protein [Streptomyces sp. DHE17-7]MBJ6623430.1 hypothetical protein [Streptomyces sp. DHE17-7]
MNQPSWSLGCEAFFYACFPLLHSWFQRIRAEHLKYWIVGVTAGIIATPWAAYVFIADKPYFPGASLGATVSAEQYWFAYNLPVTRVLDFALGMLVAQAVVRGRWFNIGMVWSGVLLAGSYVLCSHVPFLYSQRSVTIIPIVLLIAAARRAFRRYGELFRAPGTAVDGRDSFACLTMVTSFVLTLHRQWSWRALSVARPPGWWRLAWCHRAGSVAVRAGGAADHPAVLLLAACPACGGVLRSGAVPARRPGLREGVPGRRGAVHQAWPAT